MSIRYLFFVFSLLFIYPLFLRAQVHEVDSSRVIPMISIDMGFSRGVQMSRNYPIIRSGQSISLSLHRPVGQWLYLGGGVGYRLVEEESFFPIFLESKGFFRPNKKASFIYTQVGYSIGHSPKVAAVEGYDFQGGGLFSMGAGYRFPMCKKMHAVFKIGYTYQRAKWTYAISSISYYENIGFDLIDFSLGVHF